MASRIELTKTLILGYFDPASEAMFRRTEGVNSGQLYLPDPPRGPYDPGINMAYNRACLTRGWVVGLRDMLTNALNDWPEVTE